jgi:outer membrane protein assembly factor BamB
VIRRSLLSVWALLLCAGLAWSQPEAGSLRWRFVTGGEIRGAPALGHDGILYLASADRNLYAIYPDGTIKWRLPVDGRLRHSPALGHDAAVFVATDAGTLYAVRPNGTLRWQRPLPGRSCGGPAVDARGRIAIATCSGELLLVANTGHTIWQLQLSAAIAARPAVARDGTLYVATADRRRWAQALGAAAIMPIGRTATDYATILVGVEALRSIARVSGGLSHADGYRPLIVVSSEGSLPGRVRTQARSALDEAVRYRVSPQTMSTGSAATAVNSDARRTHTAPPLQG